MPNRAVINDFSLESAYAHSDDFLKRMKRMTYILGTIAMLITPTALCANSTPDQTQASILQTVAQRGPGSAEVVMQPDGSLCFKQGLGCLSAAQSFPAPPTPVRAYRFNGGGSGGVVEVFLVYLTQQIKVSGDRLRLRLLPNGDIQVRDSGGCHICDATGLTALVATYRVVDSRLVAEAPGRPDAETQANSQMQEAYALDEKCQDAYEDLQHRQYQAAGACAAAAKHELMLSKLFSEGKTYNGVGDGGSPAERGDGEAERAAIDLNMAATANSFYDGDDSEVFRLSREQAQQSLNIIRKLEKAGYRGGGSPADDPRSTFELGDQLILVDYDTLTPSLAVEKAAMKRCGAAFRVGPKSMRTALLCKRASVAAVLLTIAVSKQGSGTESNAEIALKTTYDEDAAWAIMVTAMAAQDGLGNGFASVELEQAWHFLEPINTPRGSLLAREIVQNASILGVELPSFMRMPQDR